MNPRHINISDYDYPLPPERIARYPKQVRDESKLLYYRKGQIGEHSFRDIPELLPADSLIFYNNTKVIQARLRFRKETGALIEVFCLEPHVPRDYQQNFDQRGECEWICLVGNKKKWYNGARSMQIGETVLHAEIIGPHGTSFIIRFIWEGGLSFAEILEAAGELPIPPYLNRATEESDKQNYQTVYSKIDGSVAAPTAGLHFTERVLDQLQQRGIEREEITLHVGAGTFRPVKSERMEGHEMHSESILITRHNIERLLAHDCRCTAVGTTTVRTIESLYYIGQKLIRNPHLSEADLHISQWEPYDEQIITEDEKPAAKRLEAILEWMKSNNTDCLHTTTQIIIAPGYEFHYVQRIITNFHMPQSTLLLLVSAFIGSDWRKVYDYALANSFRFLSYGDSSLLEP